MKVRILLITLVAISLSDLAGTVVAQYKGKPVKKEILKNVLQARKLQTREIVAVIKTNGVDFNVDEGVESELTGAGARPEVIAAAKAHYRGGATVAAARPPAANTGSTPTSGTAKVSGKPMDKAAIVSLLDAGVAEAQIVKNIQARGVSYYQSAKDQQDIKNAGGSQALVNLIRDSYAGSATPTKPGVETDDDDASAGGDDDDAFGLVAGTATPEALQAAVEKKTESFLPYQQLGIHHLYTTRNLFEAERFYREAIARGGSGVFVVAHDHGGNNFQTFCYGNLYVARDIVRYESHDNVHTFETSTANIEKAKMNSAFWAALNNIRGPFSIKLKTGDKESKNYNFAPFSQNENESKMLLRLLGKN